jgi:phosphoglycolate phosphatase
MSRPFKLVLFDIDGTILWSDGAGRRAMEGALTTHFGTPGTRQYRYDGKTDRQIVRDLMRLEGHDDATIDARMTDLLANYLEGLHRELADDTHVMHCFDGVHAVLDALEAEDDRALGLLTGNLEQGAHAKLRAVGVDPARFVVNAYGSDSEVRSELPGIARRRAFELLGRELDAAAIVVIGDTPADIHCTRPLGARTIAVATGRYSMEELASHGPAAVLPDLCDTEAVLRAIAEA